MSKHRQLKELEKEIQRLSILREELLNSPELKSEIEFEEKLKSLLNEYNKSLKDIIQLIEPDKSTGHDSKKTRAKRAVKVFRNPHTGESVETKGGNNKTLKVWKSTWGVTAVESWQV